MVDVVVIRHPASLERNRLARRRPPLTITLTRPPQHEDHPPLLPYRCLNCLCWSPQVRASTLAPLVHVFKADPRLFRPPRPPSPVLHPLYPPFPYPGSLSRRSPSPRPLPPNSSPLPRRTSTRSTLVLPRPSSRPRRLSWARVDREGSSRARRLEKTSSGRRRSLMKSLPSRAASTAFLCLVSPMGTERHWPDGGRSLLLFDGAVEAVAKVPHRVHLR
jgi:hypothetical protein